MSELWQQTATELAAAIAAKKVSSAEVVEAHLKRIEQVNGKVNAIVKVLADDARARAAEADRRVKAGEKLGPLHGVPFTVKANIDMKGVATTHGVPALADAIAPGDAPVVERMRLAGGIAIARTNLPDMALRVHTDSSLHGLTRNPWNLGRTAGGSSGGEGAAIATGMSPIGLGNDIGGSLRNPANCCGIASIRPSLGRVPDAAYGPQADRLLAVQQMAVQGPMARRIADVRLGLKVLMGAHPRDAWSIDAPFEGKKLKRPIKVAVVAEPPGGKTDPVIANTVRAAGDVLARAGYDVVDATPPRYAEAQDVWGRFLFTDFAVVLTQMMAMMGKEGASFLEESLRIIPPYPDAASLSQLLIKRDGIAREWSLFMEEHPLVLTPTWSQLPFEHGHDAKGAEGAAFTFEMMRPVTHANLLGLPSACVPAGKDAKTNLPIGVLLNGQRLRDDLCLEAAEVIEAKLGLPTPIDPV